jgi:hypothetical protein
MVMESLRDLDRESQVARERQPEPVLITGNTTDLTDMFPVNGWNGYYADLSVAVDNPSVPGEFRLMKAGPNPEILDKLTITANGTLRTILQTADRLVTAYVEGPAGSTFDFRMILTRHRITGEI